MPERIVWTGPALADLRHIRDYVSRDDPAAAVRLADRLRKRVLALQVHPRMGRVVPELSTRGLREVIVAPYRIVYEVWEREVVVLRVWHGRRDLSPQSVEQEPDQG